MLQLDINAEACDHCGALTHPPAVRYFYVHPLRCLLLCVMTLGVFALYWGYKNWAAIKIAEGTRVRPFWRVLFHQYFCFSLFTRIYNGAKVYGYKSRLSASKLIIFYVAGGSFLGGAVRASQNMMAFPLFSVLAIVMGGIGYLLFLLPMLLIQPAIRFHNIHAAQAARKNESGQAT